MGKILIGAAILLFCTASFGMYTSFTTPKVEEKELSSELLLGGLEQDMDVISQLENMYTDGGWVTSPKTRVDVVEKVEKLYETRFSTPAFAVEYLFSSALMNDMTLFAEAFEGQSFTEDLFEHPEPNKMIVTQEMMNRLTKNGELEQVRFVRSTYAFGKDNLNIIVDLFYTNKETIRVSLGLKKADTEAEQYVIASSVWELIRQIERRGN